MSFYTNDIKKRTAYQQDSSTRNFSQKRLDRKFQSQLSQIQRFQSQLKSSSTPQTTKRIKTQATSHQPSNPKQPLKHSEVIEKLLNYCGNPEKKSKALGMLLKLLGAFGDKEFEEVGEGVIIECCRKLVGLSIGVGNEAVNCCKMITDIFEKFEKIEEVFTKGVKELIKLYQQFWKIIKDVHEDDSFSFNSTLNRLFKIIQDFKIDKKELDDYQDSTKVKFEIYNIKQQPQQPNQQQQQHIHPQPDPYLIHNHQKRTLIFLAIQRLFALDTNWKKLSIDQFMKNFNNQHKSRILHTEQKEKFEMLHKEYLNKRTKNNIEKEQQLMRDQIIGKNDVVRMNAEVKEVEKEAGGLEANDKWVSKQN